MKTLLVMRHAKSSWKDPELSDHERPLNKRGQKDALFMGEVLLEKELLPQKILASTAVRVRETVAGLIKSCGFCGETEFLDAYYLAEPDAYLAAVRALPDNIERVMVVGHNPGMEGLLLYLARRIETIEAGTIAYLSLPVQSWGEVTAETEGDLVELLQLRDLRVDNEDKKKGVKTRKEQKEAAEKKNKKNEAADEKKRKEEKEAAAKKRKEETRKRKK